MSSPNDPVASLLDTVRTLYDAVDHFDAALAADLGVDRTALRAINAMEKGSISPGELGRRLHLASGSVTALLDRLERAGHIERSLSQTDRRRRDAHLTQGSHAKAGRRYEQLAQFIRAAFAEHAARDSRLAAETLTAVAAAFLAAAPASRPDT